MRLNKFLAKSGVASRRKSDELIQMATTEVNGKVCLDPAYDVTPRDSVYFDGKKVKGMPVMTIIRGNIVMRDGELLDKIQVKPIEFELS